MKVRLLIPSLTLIFLIVGGALAVFPDRVTAHQVWTLGVILLGAPIVFETLRNALKGRFATDVVASLSIIGSDVFRKRFGRLKRNQSRSRIH